jgi:hypothetical protein
MRKSILLALALLTVGLMCLGVHLRRGGAQNMTVRHNTKDLPEYGLTIITSSDPTFDKEMSALLGDVDTELKMHVKALKPFCIFLRNTGNQEVVAYKLKWELMDAEGRVMTKLSSVLNPAKLMGEEVPEDVETGREIRPNSTRFLAWESSLTSVLYARKYDQGQPTAAAAQKRATFLAALAEAVSRQVASIVAVTISIDGAFFADGTFVGPDAENTFAEVQAYVESKHDLAAWVEKGKREGKSSAAILDQLSSGFADAGAPPDTPPAASDFRAVLMKSHVNDLLRMREAAGDEFALDRMLLTLGRQKVKLRKKPE